MYEDENSFQKRRHYTPASLILLLIATLAWSIPTHLLWGLHAFDIWKYEKTQSLASSKRTNRAKKRRFPRAECIRRDISHNWIKYVGCRWIRGNGHFDPSSWGDVHFLLHCSVHNGNLSKQSSVKKYVRVLRQQISVNVHVTYHIFICFRYL